MPLHPEAQQFLTGVEAMGLPPFETLSVEEGRAVIAGLGGFMGEPEEVASVVDTIVPGPEADIPLRIYMPEGEGLRPAIMYFHGGGFTTGSIDLIDPLCRALANRSGCAVVAVGYRLAPEYPYPAAPTDAYVSTSWIAAKGPVYGIDNGRIAVMGDSAGANLATVTCMAARDNGDEFSIALQVLVYPVTVMADADFPSRTENSEGYLLDSGMIRWFFGHYLTGCPERAEEPYCSPLVGNLADLPPAIIVVAEYDPLRDEGIAYAERLKEDGVFVDLRREQGMIHGFFWLGAAIARGRDLVEELGPDIGKLLREID